MSRGGRELRHPGRCDLKVFCATHDRLAERVFASRLDRGRRFAPAGRSLLAVIDTATDAVVEPLDLGLDDIQRRVAEIDDLGPVVRRHALAPRVNRRSGTNHNSATAT